MHLYPGSQELDPGSVLHRTGLHLARSGVSEEGRAHEPPGAYLLVQRRDAQNRRPSRRGRDRLAAGGQLLPVRR